MQEKWRRKKGRKRRRRRNSLVSGQRQQSYRRCTTAVSDWGRDWDWDLCVIAMQMRDAEMLQWQKLEMEEYEARMKKWRHCTNLVNMGNWVCWRCASVRAVLSLAELNLITIAGNTHTLFYWQIRSFARIVLFFLCFFLKSLILAIEEKCQFRCKSIAAAAFRLIVYTEFCGVSFLSFICVARFSKKNLHLRILFVFTFWRNCVLNVFKLSPLEFWIVPPLPFFKSSFTKSGIIWTTIENSTKLHK